MKKLFGELRSNTLLRYIISFSLIVLLIITAMGAYLYCFYYRTLYNDFQASEQTYLEGIASRHENDMAVISDIVLQMGLDSSITDFKLDENPMKSLALKERLYQYTAVSRFFEGIFCAYHYDTFLYNHATSIELERFLREGLLLEDVRPQDFEAFVYSSQKGLRALPEQGTGGYLSVTSLNGMKRAVLYAYPVAPKNTTTLLFAVPEEYYTELFQGAGKERADYIVYDGTVITARGDVNAGDELLRELAYAGDGSRKVAFSQGKYMLTSKTGESGLIYCTVQSMDVFADKMVGGQWGIFLLLSLCSIPAALMITVLTRNMFGRVRSLNELLKGDGDYNLDAVESGIRTLVESHKRQEREREPLQKAGFIRMLVKGDFETKEDAYLAAENAGLNVRMPWYSVLLMGDRGDAQQRKAYEIMLEVLANETLVDGYGVKLLDRNQSLFVLFGEEQKFLDIIARFFLQIGKDACEDFVLAASAFHTDITEAPKAYLEANSAFDSRLLMDISNIIRFDGLAERKLGENRSEIYLQQLKSAIYMNDEAAMRKVIADICRQMRAGNQSLLNFRLFYHDVIHMLMKERPAEENEIGKIYNVFTLSQCLTLEDFSEVLCDVCLKLMERTKEGGENNSDVAGRAAAYMREHYSEYDLNMSFLAETLQVTPAMLTVAFKNGMGVNPSDYLAGLRLEQAKRLLEETDMLVRQISREVGYEDEHMFIRRFKKYTGKTPGQYREERQGAGREKGDCLCREK